MEQNILERRFIQVNAYVLYRDGTVQLYRYPARAARAQGALVEPAARDQGIFHQRCVRKVAQPLTRRERRQHHCPAAVRVLMHWLRVPRRVRRHVLVSEPVAEGWQAAGHRGRRRLRTPTKARLDLSHRNRRDKIDATGQQPKNPKKP